MAPIPVAMLLLAVGARWSYEDAYDGVRDGDWYIGAHNEDAQLAWGESYVMSSLASMARATGHPMYLDRLAEHIDAVLAQRDDARGVADFRGISGACWRNTSYQAGGEPYCYAVHSGMIVHPMVEFAAAVRDSPWANDPSYDGETLSDKADRYVQAVRETIEFHEFEWNAAGYYEFASEATFLAYAGQDVPFNQSHALGRALVLMAALEGDADQLAKATAMAQRFAAGITIAADGSALWNYWGGAYTGVGEDISHAAINVDFAALCAEHGIVFDESDVEAMATTFVSRVYLDDGTFSDNVGGGSTNDPGQKPQVGRWLRVARARTTVYTAVRDLYESEQPPSAIGSGAVLLGWAQLAEHEPPTCAPFFYSVDWTDRGEWREATAYGANLLAIPPALEKPCMMPVELEAPRSAELQQWDGAAYHRVQSLRAGAGIRRVAYEPRWPFVYAEDGVLWQVDDAFVDGDGIRVRETAPFVLPQIDSGPPASAELDQPFAYVPTGIGDAPTWWRLVDGPPIARMDPATAAIEWTPTSPGRYAFTIRLENDAGVDEQAFVVTVDSPGDGSSSEGEGEAGTTGDESGGSAGSSAGTEDSTGTASATGEDGGAEPRGGDASGCGCRSHPTLPTSGLVLLAIAWRRRRLKE